MFYVNYIDDIYIQQGGGMGGVNPEPVASLSQG